MKSITALIQAPSAHWVGNGFPVKSLFSYDNQAAQMSPFLLLDYAGPMHFPGDGVKRGVGVHPHRGFETVTIVYRGEVEHKGSTGKGGVIGPGDVQWMTAGAGILHEEFHSQRFSQSGGELQMVQLWVNLPKVAKMVPPGYQGIVKDTIPNVSLPKNAGSIRIIAGEFDEHLGPATTHSPMNVWDMRLNAGSESNFTLPQGWGAAIVVLEGAVSVNGSEPVTETNMVVLSRQQTGITLRTEQSSLVLLLSGDPINEPVVGHGPFVMNTKAEIVQAFNDLKEGQFGRL